MIRSSIHKLGLYVLILITALGAVALCVFATTVIDSDSIGRIWIGAGTILLLLFTFVWSVITVLQCFETFASIIQKQRLAKGK